MEGKPAENQREAFLQEKPGRSVQFTIQATLPVTQLTAVPSVASESGQQKPSPWRGTGARELHIPG